MKKPFIHLFTNMDKYYFFDVNRNKIVNISVEEYKSLIEHVTKGTEIDNKIYEKYKNKGFLNTERTYKSKNIFSEIAVDFLENKLRKICLQVTQNCNFRCEYCVYSGNYINRQHNAQKMEWETAKLGMDFLLKHSKESSSIDVGFYGGEPLLEYDLVLDCIKYMKKKAYGKQVSFNLTTNGSLLTEEIAKEVMEHNIRITISLDGPEEIHNKNRKFASSGNGTYESVYRNIQRIIKKFPEFKKNLLFSVVIDPTIQLNCVTEYIAAEDELFDESTIMGSLVSNIGRKEKSSTSENFAADWQYLKYKFFLKMLGRLNIDSELKLLQSSQIQLINFIKSMKMEVPDLYEEGHHSGPCIPGGIRLFMNTQGHFFPCEKVSETSEYMKIGDVYNGFDFEKVNSLLNIGMLTERECSTCFAFRNCTVCATMADDGESLSREKKIEYCKFVRRNFEDILKDACTLHECGLKIEQLAMSNY